MESKDGGSKILDILNGCCGGIKLAILLGSGVFIQKEVLVLAL